MLQTHLQKLVVFRHFHACRLHAYIGDDEHGVFLVGEYREVTIGIGGHPMRSALDHYSRTGQRLAVTVKDSSYDVSPLDSGYFIRHVSGGLSHGICRQPSSHSHGKQIG